jgi:hypothetical protein
MSTPKDSVDEVPELLNITPTIVAHPDDVEKAIEKAVKKEIAKHKDIAGANLGESTISKDWVERKTDAVDHKIAIENVKNEARFEKLILQSDIKFEKLIGEIKQLESSHIKWMVGIAFSLISFTIAAISVSTSLLLKAIPSSNIQQAQPHSEMLEKNIQNPPDKDSDTPSKKHKK